MIEIGIMIEGQEDLTWERFFRLADTVEATGFDHLFRSDHLKPLEVAEDRETLALWPSLTALALRTQRIRFGPMVCSMTFRLPVLVAKMAASVSVLSQGRLDLGLGAGWYAGEHRQYGIPYPKYGTRLEMLDEGLQLVKMLWSGLPSTFSGQHYQLEDANSYPLPLSPSIIVGGRGDKTLQLVARHADEWNCAYAAVEVFQEKTGQLDEICVDIGRDPATLRRSLMTPFVIGKTKAAVQQRIDAHRAMFPSLPPDLPAWRAAGLIGGSPAEVAEQLSRFVEAGAARFMLQQNDLDDLDSLSLLASEVLPEFR